MKLIAAMVGQVVRNINNGSHYRYERPEKGKVRIWPLELFPTGLLIPKPTPTLVEPDIEVVLIGPWHEPMTVEGKPKHSRAVYERELAECELELVVLEAAYEELPAGGVGKESRGSWANKIKNRRSRIATLQAGLGFTETVPREQAQVQPILSALTVQALVQLPSGRPGKITAMRRTGGQVYANVTAMHHGYAISMPLPCEVLRPWDDARVCTL